MKEQTPHTHVDSNECETWQSEMRNALRNFDQLNHYVSQHHPQQVEMIIECRKFIQTNTNDEFKSRSIQKYPLFLPKRLIEKIIKQGISSALYRQFVPDQRENQFSLQQAGLIDPIGDQDFQVTHHLIHRYHNRALFLPTNICPIICRYCFRKNELYDGGWGTINLEETRKYLEQHSEINEIIFTGGDPLSLSNEKLDSYLKFFGQFNHIQFIRFHTRFPVIIPSRIETDFCQLIKKHQKRFIQISMAIHCNHVSEFDDDIIKAIQILKELNIQLLSQTVLLKDVNTDFNSLLELFNQFIKIGIRPYYLHHPDIVKGAMHFRISLTEGRMLYQQLRNHLPGWAIPQYVVDLPNGQGKTPAYNPENYTFSGKLINRYNEESTYVDAVNSENSRPVE